MKRLVLLALALVGLAFSLSAQMQAVYVSARIVYLYESANAASPKVVSLKQGDQLLILDTAEKWYEVATADGSKQGWVNRLFVGETVAVSQSDVGLNMSDLSAVATRTRASAYTTSSAATRGLSADNVRQRENLAFSAYDFSVVPWLNTFSYPEDTVIAFAEAEGLVP